MKRRSGALLVLGLVLGASCGVDKEGTAENLIKSLEDSNGSELNDEQKDCLTNVVKEYSDDDLKALEGDDPRPELLQEFTGKAYDCIVMLGS